MADLRGLGQLAIGGVTGVTDIVEEMHRNIARFSPIIGASPTGPARGISGMVYRSVRGVTRVCGFGLETSLRTLERSVEGHGISSPRRDALVAALNGVLGDHLEAAGNPLAIQMHFRHGGRPLGVNGESTLAVRPGGGRILVLVHGLCMSDSWQRDGHDHGAALARDLGFTPVYARYNSGLHISTNGRQLAAELEDLITRWPAPVTELVIVGHSMGGLVARSAHHYAGQYGHRWTRLVRKILFVGTPHHGAPLERAGNRFHRFLRLSPYSAPLARLGQIRSFGVTDLRFSNLVDEDWQHARPDSTRDERRPLPLPQGIRCYAIAASRGVAPAPASPHRSRGDGLVPVSSALGLHWDGSHELAFPRERRRVFYGMGHLDLLSSPRVYQQLRDWLDAED